jgi:Ca-activated chloride channel family protein
MDEKTGLPRPQGALGAVWARGHLRDLEDQYATGAGDLSALERRILAVSLRHHVLCRFTALVAVDSRVVAEGGSRHHVIQPVELPSGWEAPVRFAAGPAAPAGYTAAPSASLDFAGLAGIAAAPLSMASARSGLQASAGFEQDHLAEARLQAASEAQLLRDSGTRSTPERLVILSDLSSRLDAVIQHLGPEAEPLRELITALAACESPTPPRDDALDALWQRALDVLEAFAGKRQTSRAFWKHA